jgi:hypothetical protein
VRGNDICEYRPLFFSAIQASLAPFRGRNVFDSGASPAGALRVGLFFVPSFVVTAVEARLRQAHGLGERATSQKILMRSPAKSLIIAATTHKGLYDFLSTHTPAPVARLPVVIGAFD